MAATYIKLGTGEYSEGQAKSVIAGYCFGQTTLTWASVHPGVGDPLSSTQRARWAYRSYDCTAPAPGTLDAADISITTALNSRISGKTVMGIMAVSREISDALAVIGRELTFWELDPVEVTSIPADSEPAWQVWRAWYLLMGVSGVDIAVCHKVLHHKRPSVFPLLDRITEGAYPLGKAWVHIHGDLQRQRDQFEELESWFAELAKRHHGVPLTRLRLHDILLWCHRAGEADEAAGLGRPLIS